MDEPGVRAMLDELAASEPPPSRVSIELARSQGRARLRWRRAGLAGTPVLAAVAVTAIVVALSAAPGPAGSALPSGSGTASASPSASPSSSASASPSPAALPAAPRRFNPAVPYVSWGWLPAGESMVTGFTNQTDGHLTAGPRPGVARWTLTTYAAGQCRFSAGNLNCAVSGGGLETPIGPGPMVSGRRAYVSADDAYLVWEYARDGWAWLGLPPAKAAPDRKAAVRDAIQVAESIRFGESAGLSLAYAAQLTNLPGHWRITQSGYKPVSGRLLTGLSMAVRGHRDDHPEFGVHPATANDKCYFYPDGQSVREVIDGYQVTVTHIPGERGRGPFQSLCAADAGGLSVFISEYDAHPLVDVVSLFRDHLRLLGPDPANWASSPVG